MAFSEKMGLKDDEFIKKKTLRNIVNMPMQNSAKKILKFHKNKNVLKKIYKIENIL